MEGNIVDLNIKLWTILFVWFNCVVLFLVMRWLLFKPVKAFMDGRKNTIQKEFESAENAKKTAHEFKTQYEGKMAGINEEKKKIIDEARKMGNFIYEQSREEAEKEKTRIITNAEKEKVIIFEKAKEQLKRETAELSVAIAQEILKREINAENHKTLVNEIIDELPKVKV